jgi:predicted metal-dependent peptidase
MKHDDVVPEEVTQVQGPVDPFDEDKKLGRYTYGAALAEQKINRNSDRYHLAVTGAMIWLRKFRPFYGFVIDEMSVTKTYNVKTACVSIEDGTIKMELNPDFFALLSMRQGAGVIAHECIHVINLHMTRYRKMLPMPIEKQTLVNWAMDLADNSLQAKPGDIPEWGLFPNQFRIPDKEKPKDKWAQFPARDTFETYLELLTMLQKEDPSQLPKMRFKFIVRIGDDGEGGDGGDDGLLDDHEVWEVDNATASEIVEEVIRQRMRRAVERARTAGVDPGSLSDVVTELLRTDVVNFAEVFSGRIGRFISNIRHPTLARPSRRYGMPPGRIMSRKLDIIWYQDTSGSMSDDEVVFGLSEARSAAASGLANVVVQQFDACLQGEAVALNEWDIGMRVHGRGGTILRPVIDDINKKRPDLAIISTDGGLEHNLLPDGVECLFIVTNGGYASDMWRDVIKLPPFESITARMKKVG